MRVYKLLPVTKNYVWGGTALRGRYNIKADSDKIAEAWVLSTHKDGQCVIEGGSENGKTLAEIIQLNPEFIGINVNKAADLPVMTKLIDANTPLSVQVHPSDEYALKNENQLGKTEMWYIIDADPNAYIYYGFNCNTSKEEFAQHIQNNTVESVLNKVPVQKGQVFFIEAGTIHAIGAGIIIAEIQENSNVTYRVYDYNRKDDSGNLRELHVKRSLEVLNYKKQDNHAFKPKGTLLAECKYFTANIYNEQSELNIYVTVKSFTHLLFLDGEGTISIDNETIKFAKGDSYFAPAGEYTIAIRGDFTVIETYI